MHASMSSRWLRAEQQHITHRSWLKLLCTSRQHAGRDLPCAKGAPEHDEDPAAFLSERVLNGDFDIIECNVGSPSGRGIGSLDGLGFYAFASRDENDSKSILGSYS